MDRRSQGGLGPLVTAVAVLVGAAVVYFGVLAFLSSRERATAPITVTDADLGVRVLVEPGDEIELGLLGHPGRDEAAWVVTEIDATVVEAVAARHEVRAANPPDPAFLARAPAAVRALWSDLPTPDRPPDEVNPDGDMWRYPMTTFTFEGRAAGESRIALDLLDGDRVVHSFAFTVEVVDGEVCDRAADAGPATMLPARCG